MPGLTYTYRMDAPRALVGQLTIGCPACQAVGQRGRERVGWQRLERPEQARTVRRKRCLRAVSRPAEAVPPSPDLPCSQILGSCLDLASCETVHRGQPVFQELDFLRHQIFLQRLVGDLASTCTSSQLESRIKLGLIRRAER